MSTVTVASSAGKKKLIQEVVILIVVVVVIGAFTLIKAAKTAPAVPAHKTATFDTSFDDAPLKVLSTKDSNYPDVTPRKDELGKSDPFAK